MTASNKSSSVEGILGGAGGGGGTPSFPILAPSGLVGAPSYSWSAGPTSGLFFDGSAMNWVLAGTAVFKADSTPQILINPTFPLVWNSAALGGGGPDTAIGRITGGVMGAVSPAAATWFQNVPGEEALNANYTNGTAAFTNTNLNITVVSGRTYNFELNLFISQSVAVDGWAIDFNGGTAAMTNFVAQALSTAETGIIVVLANATSAALATVINATSTVTTGGQMIKVQGSFVPSGNGTFIVRARVNTLTTGVITIKRGSNLITRDSRAV